jgi:predicted ATPase/class 3 adenylate cyclase
LSEVGRAELPRGTVTLLFTDVEGSTQLVGRLGEAYEHSLAAHRRIVRDSVARHGGVEVDTQGDAFFMVFERAIDAVSAAVEIQRRVDEHEWHDDAPLRARMGIHTGEPRLGAGGYYVGIDLTRGSRICTAAHGGQIVLSRPTLDLVRDQVDAIELGAHLLKGIDEPERLYQLRAEGLRESVPPLRAPTPGNLPRARTALVGRRRELSEVVDLLRADDALITLTGPGGAGKTRLVIEAARHVAGDLPDGVFFVPLAAVTEPERVAELIAESLDVREEGTESLPDALARAIGGRTMLLVLDNFEQVVSGREVVSKLIDACPNLKVLTSSRERLHLSGEREYAVPSLSASDAEALFRARVLVAAPEVAVGEGDPVVSAICERLDRLPLAIELAAARTRLLPLQAILERLEDRLAFLRDGAHDLPSRQQTLEAAIDWSYQLLDADERRALERLSVFAGGFSLDAAEAVIGAGTALVQIGSLRDKSLVVPRMSSDGAPRFGMLETIAEYAGARLRERGEEEEVRSIHARYFLQLAEQAELAGRRESDWLGRLAEEQRNLNAALAWSRGEDLLQGAGALWRYWFVRGHLTEGRGWLGTALESRGEPSLHLQRALFGASTLALSAGDMSAAHALASERVEVCTALGDAESLTSALSALANVKVWLGEPAEAIELYERAAEQARTAGFDEARAAVMNNLGYLALSEGDAVAGESRCAEAAAVFESLGRHAEAANARVNVAAARVLLDRADEALPELEQSLGTFLDHENADGISCALDVAAAAMLDLGDGERAGILLGAAGAARRRSGATAPPVEQQLRDRTKGALERTLGPDAFAAARSEGELLAARAAAELVVGYRAAALDAPAAAPLASSARPRTT